MIALDEIIVALEAAGYCMNTYFDRKTGEVVIVSEEDLSAAKQDSLDDIPEWQHENVAMVKYIVPHGIPAGQFREYIDKFAGVLPVVDANLEAKNLAKAVRDQITDPKGGIDSLENVITEYSSKLIRRFESKVRIYGGEDWLRQRNYMGVDITDPMVVDKISDELKSHCKNIELSKTDGGFKFIEKDAQGNPVRTVSYYADGPMSGKAEYDKDGREINEKIYIPRR